MTGRSTFLSVLFAGALAAGCWGTVRGGAYVTSPDLVYIGPDVQVVADYDQPVFYADNVYWRYDGGVWYQSPSHDRGWVRSERVPPRVRNIDHPEGYVHYRAHGRAGAPGQQDRGDGHDNGHGHGEGHGEGHH